MKRCHRIWASTQHPAGQSPCSPYFALNFHINELWQISFAFSQFGNKVLLATAPIDDLFIGTSMNLLAQVISKPALPLPSPSAYIWVLSRRGPMEWNGVRHHHMDALQLSDGSWLAVMDGDSVISGHISRGILSRLGIAASVIAFALCLWCSHNRCMACARSRAGRLCCLPLVMRPLQLQWSRLKDKSSGSTIDLSECPTYPTNHNCSCALLMGHEYS